MDDWKVGDLAVFVDDRVRRGPRAGLRSRACTLEVGTVCHVERVFHSSRGYLRLGIREDPRTIIGHGLYPDRFRKIDPRKETTRVDEKEPVDDFVC